MIQKLIEAYRAEERRRMLVYIVKQYSEKASDVLWYVVVLLCVAVAVGSLLTVMNMFVGKVF